MVQHSAGRLRLPAATDGHSGAGDLLCLPSARGFPARPLPHLDLEDDPCFYGFPIFGEAGTKAGQDAGGREVTAETRTFEPDQAALRRVCDFLSRHIPGALGPIIYTKTCLYTLTPDRDFVLDRLPDYPGALVAIGGGHGFKFASVVGKILAELAVDGRTGHELTPFRFDRAILQLENPPKHYMV